MEKVNEVTFETIEAEGVADCGNSTTKTIYTAVEGRKARKQPSVIKFLSTIPTFEDDDLDTLIANLQKNIVVSFASSGVNLCGMYAVGDRANDDGGSSFNVKRHKKSEQDLTVIQPLSMLAVMAIQNEYNKNKQLPTSLIINMTYTTAIPVVDFEAADAKALEKRLTGSHTIVVYVGEGKQVHVTINVTSAKVYKEGIPAMYAIANAEASMFKKYNERYKEKFTGNDFTKRKILLADIGDGTLELIYVVDGKPIINKSTGERLGVGHASEKAIAAFKKNNKIKSKITRTMFMDKVLNGRDKWHDEAEEELKKAAPDQEKQIYDAIIDAIEGVLSGDVDDLVLFGGGTNVFVDLHDKLIHYANDYKINVLWIDGKEAALLNALGLAELSKVSFKK